ncbi:MAG: hypothetical protein ACE5E9_13750 [Nitrospinaceae bacterium]
MMVQRVSMEPMVRAICVLAGFSILTGGCVSFLPSARQNTGFRWATFEEAKTAFEKIVPFQTNSEDLRKLGFDPFVSPNIRILTYLDIIQKFTPNPSFKKEDLDQELVECLDAKKACTAYEVSLQRIQQKRYGNFFLDLLGFKRKTRKMGWEFHAFVVLKKGVVVYKVWSGRPKIQESSEKKNPLGPFQEPESIISRVPTGSLF